MADLPSRVTRAEEQIAGIKEDIKFIFESNHKSGNRIMTLEQNAAVIKNDLTLIKKLVFGACGMMLMAVVGGMVKLSMDFSQTENLRQLVNELKYNGGHR